jgi:hypothetical protein
MQQIEKYLIVVDAFIVTFNGTVGMQQIEKYLIVVDAFILLYVEELVFL